MCIYFNHQLRLSSKDLIINCKYLSMCLVLLLFIPCTYRKPIFTVPSVRYSAASVVVTMPGFKAWVCRFEPPLDPQMRSARSLMRVLLWPSGCDAWFPSVNHKFESQLDPHIGWPCSYRGICCDLVDTMPCSQSWIAGSVLPRIPMSCLAWLLYKYYKCVVLSVVLLHLKDPLNYSWRKGSFFPVPSFYLIAIWPRLLKTTQKNQFFHDIISVGCFGLYCHELVDPSASVAWKQSD